MQDWSGDDRKRTQILQIIVRDNRLIDNMWQMVKVYYHQIKLLHKTKLKVRDERDGTEREENWLQIELLDFLKL